MKNIQSLIYILLPLLMTSCIKEGFDKENCPGEYFITAFYPENMGNGEIKNMSATIIDANGKEMTPEIGSDKPLDLEDGVYTIVVVKDQDNTKTIVKGTTVEVKTLPDGTAGDPGEKWLGGYCNFIANSNPGQNGETNCTTPAILQSRPLVINVKFEGENASLIGSVDGWVDGIALSRDLNNGFAPTDGKPRHPASKTGTITYDFSKNDQGIYTDSRTLLGINGDGSQTMNITVHYTGGVEKVYTVDITHDMDEFHTKDVLKPWVIDVTFRLGSDFNATIEDWKVGLGLDMEAH